MWKQSKELAIELIKYIKQRLNIQIFILTAFLLIGIAVVTYGFIAVTTPKSYLNELDLSLDRSVQSLVGHLEQAELSEIEKLLQFFSEEHGIIIQLYDKDENRIDYGSKLYFAADPSYNAYTRQDRTSITKDYIFVPKNSEDAYTIRVLGSQQRVNLFSQALRNILPWLIALIALITIIASWLYSRYITRPVIRLSRMSKELAGLNFEVYVQNKREDEIGILSDNLNKLSERLSIALGELQAANTSLKKDVEREQELEKQQLSFFSAVSHELKTPITVLKGQLQGMLYGVGGYKDRDKYLRRTLEIVSNMEEMVVEILSVSHIRSTGFSINIEPINPQMMMRTVLQEYEELAVQKNISIDIDLQNTPEIHADTGLLGKAVSNIMSNAFRYSPENSEVRVKLFPAHEEVILQIENTGVSIPEEEIPRLFQAFTRGEESRNRETGGSGLGLYLVKMILDLHQYAFRMSNTSVGICFEVHCR